jgi:hypothetical protein
MSKLTLHETVTLALTNHFPLELVPGRTVGKGGETGDNNSYRFHCLIQHPDFPELQLRFGDENHGYLFDSAWTSAIGGRHLRVTEAAVRALLESTPSVPRWTREMPASENPVHLPLRVTNPDLAHVIGVGTVQSNGDNGVEVNVEGRTLVLVGVGPQPLGSEVTFEGVFSYPATVNDAVLFEY